ncbi:MAG: hypothetical protein K9M02_14910 [Thiohalocapsa sp.]|nr:hypothetical protein [Thiohalocapsa sp.]
MGVTRNRPNSARYRAIILPLLAVVLLLPGIAAAQESCLKLVFNRYCLGGDINVLLQQSEPVFRQDDGERIALVYFDGPEKEYVMAWRSRIYKVVRRYRIASQMRYDELYRLLREKYGEGEDRSQFPSHARTPGLKHIAIRRGEGRAAHVWPVEGGWRIELSWTREMGLSLAYLADELDRQQSEAMNRGL